MSSPPASSTRAPGIPAVRTRLGPARVLAGVVLLALAVACPAETFLDRVGQALSFNSAGGNARARVSGTLELEGIAFTKPAPGLIQSEDHALFSPRLTLFLDAQAGAAVYGFAQVRVDRGFDPGNRSLEARLDEYALRFTPSPKARMSLQAGRFAAVIGNWAPRHGSWANPFIGAPLPYENPTGIWDNEPPRTSAILLQWSHVLPGLPPAVTRIEKNLRVPILWGPGYAMGAAVLGEWRELRYALEVKQAALSSRPETWRHAPAEAWAHPTVSGRLGYAPNPTWNFGLSASAGSYLRPEAAGALPEGRNRGDYRQLVLAHDVAFAWRHLQIWAEAFAVRFEVPGIGNADTFAYYVETKYTFAPQIHGALRWNQQVFGAIPHSGRATAWGHELWRIDAAPAYRFSPHTQLKLQYSLQRGDAGERRFGHALAAQFTLRF
jgi:hypothetical protein